MSEIETKKLRESILNGLNIALHRLIKEKKKNNSELVVSSKGKVVRVRASEL